jgi:hypothetical protein
MATKTDKPAADPSIFERFVQKILQVPKEAINAADAAREKRKRRLPRSNG